MADKPEGLTLTLDEVQNRLGWKEVQIMQLEKIIRDLQRELATLRPQEPSDADSPAE